MNNALAWLQTHHEDIVRGLADLVAIPSISTDGEHSAEIERTAKLTCDQMREAGLTNVEVLRVGKSLPYAYGEWLEAGPTKPTLFLYAHHDVQPINYIEQWKSDPWTLTRRDGRLFARGSADDKAAISAFLGAIAAFRKTDNTMPVNIKMVVEGEEEIGSKNLMKFFEVYRDKIKSDVIVVCDTENIEVGLPCITYSLRGIVQVHVEVKTAAIPVHSGMAGGALPDAAIALNAILGRLYWDNGPVGIPGFHDDVRPVTAKERAVLESLPWDDGKFANETGLTVYEQTTRRPAVTVVAMEASNIKNVSNQVLPKAEAILSCRIVPDQKPEHVLKVLQEFLRKDAPWGAEVTVKPHGKVKWWITDPNGPAFESAMAALRVGFNREPVAIGSGGSIGFVGPLAELFGGAPALLLGIEDPASNAHAPNESLHEGDFKKLMASLVLLFENLGKLPASGVK